eukprot:Clim_evm51s191 gene=Clim_evmTU51s191
MSWSLSKHSLDLGASDDTLGFGSSKTQPRKLSRRQKKKAGKSRIARASEMRQGELEQKLKKYEAGQNEQWRKSVYNNNVKRLRKTQKSVASDVQQQVLQRYVNEKGVALKKAGKGDGAKKQKKGTVFTEEDFQRFAKTYFAGKNVEA